jgi:hypothetical protein
MNALLSKAFEMRLAAFWFILFSINSLCTCVLAASSGCVWNQLDTQSKWTVVIAVAANWTNAIMAYVSKAAKKIESGQLPFDDTTFIPKPPLDNPQKTADVNPSLTKIHNQT